MEQESIANQLEHLSEVHEANPESGIYYVVDKLIGICKQQQVQIEEQEKRLKELEDWQDWHIDVIHGK